MKCLAERRAHVVMIGEPFVILIDEVHLANRSRGVLRFLEKVLERNLKKIEKVIEGVGEYISVLTFSDDLGAQDRLLIPLDKYRKLFKPIHKKMWDYIHQNSDCKVLVVPVN